MKRPICEKHEFDIKMHRLYVRIAQKFNGIGWKCLVCGDQIMDAGAIKDENQKSVLDFINKKID